MNYSASVATMAIENTEKEEEVKEVIMKDILGTMNISPLQKSKEYRNKSSIDFSMVHDIVNHPAHVIESSGELSPSALIPFCQLEGWLGVKIDQFDVPICNVFEAKILNNQLCYEVDPNTLRLKNETLLNRGITFYIDNNNERMTSYDKGAGFMIYLNTLGEGKSNKKQLYNYQLIN